MYCIKREKRNKEGEKKRKKRVDYVTSSTGYNPHCPLETSTVHLQRGYKSGGMPYCVIRRYRSCPGRYRPEGMVHRRCPGEGLSFTHARISARIRRAMLEESGGPTPESGGRIRRTYARIRRTHGRTKRTHARARRECWKTATRVVAGNPRSAR